MRPSGAGLRTPNEAGGARWRRAIWWRSLAAATIATALIGAARAGSVSTTRVAPVQAGDMSSSAVLAQLPDGEFKRQFVIDCTNCHQLDTRITYPDNRQRTHAEWRAIIVRMMQYAGSETPFPVMSGGLNPDTLAAWLERHLTRMPRAEAPLDARATRGKAEIREYLLPVATDLPHDLAVDSLGRIVVTGMMSHIMYVLDTASGRFHEVPIPVPDANPRAVEIARDGSWWVLLGVPNTIAHHEPSTSAWTLHDIGMYGHSIALSEDKAWFNGHFTRDPEQIGYVDRRTGERRVIAAPSHPRLASVPGGPIPYELRLDRSDRIWMSELQGNRVLRYTPSTNRWHSYEMPTRVSGPRRFDIDASGTLWIPAYSGNSLVRLDPGTGVMQEHAIPRKDAFPYVARIDGERVWIGTNASDEIYAFDIPTRAFTVYPLPSRGAIVRHMVLDPRNRDLWIAYGASPGIPARIARLRMSAR